jgi:hypothetical protein
MTGERERTRSSTPTSEVHQQIGQEHNPKTGPTQDFMRGLRLSKIQGLGYDYLWFCTERYEASSCRDAGKVAYRRLPAAEQPGRSLGARGETQASCLANAGVDAEDQDGTEAISGVGSSADCPQGRLWFFLHCSRPLQSRLCFILLQLGCQPGRNLAARV